MSTPSRIEIEMQGLGRILLNRNVSVPVYQRSYAWEDEHVRDLLNDITEAISGSENEYFLGSIVTTNNKSPRAEVVDGQQRLATATILLAAIRDHFYITKDYERANTISSDLLSKKDLKTLTLIPKLKLNDADHDFFASRILLPPTDPGRGIVATKPSHHRIARAAYLAEGHIARMAKAKDATELLTDLVGYLTDSVKVIWVQVPDDANAFMVFETLNDRGLTLAITDLLKNHLFGLSGNRLGEVQRAWVSMTSTLEAVDEDEVALTFIRHYVSSSYGFVREKELYAEIKRRVDTQPKAVAFASALEKNAHKYAAIVNTADALWVKYGDTCRKHMETLRALRMIQIRPLILSVLDTLKDSEVKATLRNMVSWSVRFLVHGGLGGGTLETHYCQAAKEIRAGTLTTASQLFNKLKSVIPNDVQFRDAFVTAAVSKTYLARYYLRALEQHRRGDSDPELVPNDNADVINLEHVLPQTPSTAWKHIPLEEQVVLVKRLGNLALMKTKINTKVGNDGYPFKKQYYRGSQYALTSSIATESTWDRAAIDRRQNIMADLAVKTWPVK
ncbi:MAG: DUF262 domain-containing HNH endonuclease family protein [Deltaproteobacteria bacterium]|nr:DUF262 domain-containing HNH endonuclease family protein [Deltaproteobacteria bacterium]